MSACPERITQARELAGLSKTDLAEKLKVSPAAVAQWETGSKHPTAENIVALAHALEVPMPLLLKPMPREVLHKGPVTFRSWKSANTRRANGRAERLSELVTELYLWLGQRVSLPPVAIPEVQERNDIDAITTECRRAWGLGDRPILKLGELLESKGILLGVASFGDHRFDAFSCIVNGRPHIFLGDDKKDRARSRFDAAHELGHLIMHQHLTEEEISKPDVLDEIESEANKFASAFLMPAETFRRDVYNPTLDGFLKLKPKWGVSVGAMVFRARGLGLITEGQYSELFRQMGMKRWRQAKGEPFDDLVPAIRGSIGKKSLEVLESSGLIQGWEIPSEMPLPPKVFCDVFQADLDHFEPAELGKIIPMASFLNDSRRQ